MYTLADLCSALQACGHESFEFTLYQVDDFKYLLTQRLSGMSTALNNFLQLINPVVLGIPPPLTEGSSEAAEETYIATAVFDIEDTTAQDPNVLEVEGGDQEGQPIGNAAQDPGEEHSAHLNNDTGVADDVASRADKDTEQTTQDDLQNSIHQPNGYKLQVADEGQIEVIENQAPVTEPVAGDTAEDHSNQDAVLPAPEDEDEDTEQASDGQADEANEEANLNEQDVGSEFEDTAQPVDDEGQLALQRENPNEITTQDYPEQTDVPEDVSDGTLESSQHGTYYLLEDNHSWLSLLFADQDYQDEFELPNNEENEDDRDSLYEGTLENEEREGKVSMIYCKDPKLTFLK